MSIYAAEENSRREREEILLSRLFGTLNIVDRDEYLGEILRRADVDVAKGEYEKIQIQFWPELGLCRPDVVLESDSFLLFVVGWKRDAIDLSKLSLLAENGWKLSPRFNLLLITDGTSAPEELQSLNDELPPGKEPPYRWIGWNTIYRSLYRSLKCRDEKPPARDLLNDLLGLFAAEGRAPFIGFDDAVLRDYRESLPVFDRLSTSIRLLMSDLDAHLHGTGIRRISLHGNEVTEFPLQAPRGIRQGYADESWDPGILSVGELFLNVDYRVGEVRVGFRSNTSDPDAKALLVEGRSRIAEDLKEKEEVMLRLVGEEGTQEPCKDSGLLARLDTLNGGDRITGVELLSVFDGSRDDLIPFLVESLVTFRDVAATIPLLPLHRYSGESQQFISVATRG